MQTGGDGRTVPTLEQVTSDRRNDKTPVDDYDREEDTSRKNQCCGAETICFRSGSDFQKVSAPAPAPAPAPAITLELPVVTDFILKSTFFIIFYERKST